eukprot:GHVS01032573.1.p1 GENE.GHVS01032573.1~~GHVS01032573.1.p1  ORF type:complete len:117 (+),score=16.49 GHVS01032573.1:273-623(+)
MLLLSYLAASDLCCLSLSSKTLYALTSVDDIWFQLLLSHLESSTSSTDTSMSYRHSWKLSCLFSIRRSSHPLGRNAAKEEKESMSPLPTTLVKVSGLYSDMLFQKWYCKTAQLPDQ